MTGQRRRATRWSTLVENDQALTAARKSGHYLEAFLIVHALIEAAMRAALQRYGRNQEFSGMVRAIEGLPVRWKDKTSLVHRLDTVNRCQSLGSVARAFSGGCSKRARSP